MMTKDFKIRLPVEIKEALSARAERNDRSVAAETLNIIKRALAAEKDMVL